MDEDLIPQGGLRSTREPLGTFTDTRTVHPDEIWHPLGGELDSRAPSLPSADDQGDTTDQTRPDRAVPVLTRASSTSTRPAT